jgi:hypothetical protein
VKIEKKGPVVSERDASIMVLTIFYERRRFHKTSIFRRTCILK